MLDKLEANVRSIIPEDNEDNNVNDEEHREGEFDYLMNMAIKSFTNKRIRELTDTLAKIEEEINALKAKSPKNLWLDDLKELEEAYDKF